MEIISPQAAIDWLAEASRYFENRPTKGEDSAIWSNIYNSRNCLKIANLIKSLYGDKEDETTDS